MQRDTDMSTIAEMPTFRPVDRGAPVMSTEAKRIHAYWRKMEARASRLMGVGYTQIAAVASWNEQAGDMREERDAEHEALFGDRCDHGESVKKRCRQCDAEARGDALRDAAKDPG